MVHIADFILSDFLSERPAIKLTALARELDFDLANLKAIIRRERKIPQDKRGTFREVLKKYGAQIQ